MKRDSLWIVTRKRNRRELERETRHKAAVCFGYRIANIHFNPSYKSGDTWQTQAFFDITSIEDGRA